MRAIRDSKLPDDFAEYLGTGRPAVSRSRPWLTRGPHDPDRKNCGPTTPDQWNLG
jgi:hypothetical protein